MDLSIRVGGFLEKKGPPLSSLFFPFEHIYLYNPIHEEYIHNKNSKKWSIIVNMTQNNLLYIPTIWFYNIETTDECILLHIDADTYFTSIYNYYRN